MYSSFYIFMFKEIKKYGLIDKIIIIMANLKNDFKFDSQARKPKTIKSRYYELVVAIAS